LKGFFVEYLERSIKLKNFVSLYYIRAMKYLFSLSLSLIVLFGLTLSSCKKSSQTAGTDTSIYKKLPDSGRYVVKTGTITLNENGKTTTYTAPEDDIFIWVNDIGFEVHGSKPYSGYDLFGMTLRQGAKNEILGNFYSSHQIGIDKIYGTNSNTSITVKDFNNTTTGVLLNASFTCSYYDLYTNGAPFPVSGSINLMLGKK
jgi:hypothetical protein